MSTIYLWGDPEPDPDPEPDQVPDPDLDPDPVHTDKFILGPTEDLSRGTEAFWEFSQQRINW